MGDHDRQSDPGRDRPGIGDVAMLDLQLLLPPLSQPHRRRPHQSVERGRLRGLSMGQRSRRARLAAHLRDHLRLAGRVAGQPRSSRHQTGPPGAGKSTWRATTPVVSRLSWCVRTTCAAIYTPTGEIPPTATSSSQKGNRAPGCLLQADRSVLVDATHYQHRYRTYLRQMVSGIDVRRVAMWFDIPVEVCLGDMRGEGASRSGSGE